MANRDRSVYSLRLCRVALYSCLAAACSTDPEEGALHPVLTPAEKAALEDLSPPELPAPPPDVSNAWADDPKAALLGLRLFFETRLSGELLDPDNAGDGHALGTVGDVGKVSCAGCHLPEGGFSDTRSVNQQLSLGAGWGIRRTPSILDVGHSNLIMWDGRSDSLFGQVFGPIESAVEMNTSRLFVAERIFELYRDEYEAVFGQLPPLDDAERFPPLSARQTGCRELDAENHCTAPTRGNPGDGAEYDALSPEDRDAVTRVVANMGKAIGAYERLLACGPSRFDLWMHGAEAALSPDEVRGARLFVGKAKCVSCHSGPMLSDEAFHNVGLMPQIVSTVFLDANDAGAEVGVADLLRDPLNVAGRYSDGDDGRIPRSVGPSLRGAFRTPKLRCVSQRPSFMHTGQQRTLETVVAFFDRGGNPWGYLGTNELTPLGLTPRERSDLVAFLMALEGPGPEDALRRPPAEDARVIDPRGSGQ